MKQEMKQKKKKEIKSSDVKNVLIVILLCFLYISDFVNNNSSSFTIILELAKNQCIDIFSYGYLEFILSEGLVIWALFVWAQVKGHSHNGSQRLLNSSD